MTSDKFVSVINRDRDGYEVPLALHEAGLLDRHVTDYYAGQMAARFLPSSLGKRRKSGLPGRLVSSHAQSFLTQVVSMAAGREMTGVFARTDRMLGQAALEMAMRRGANLYCYGGFVPRPGEAPPSMKIIDFEFHPHPDFEFGILEEDAQRFSEIDFAFRPLRPVPELDRYRWGWQAANAVTCASTFTKRSLVSQGCPADRIEVIPYGGIDARGVRPRPPGPCRFLFVGQGMQRKGLHHLARVWRELAPADAELTVVCYSIDPAIQREIEGAAIKLLPRQSRAGLDSLYATSDVFVLPSLVEGFGLVYLEALSAGCHLIASRNTGIPDLPLGEQAATLVDAGDLNGLAKAIEVLIEAKRNGSLNPETIAASASAWSWTDFRTRIAHHARGVIAD